MNLFVSKVQSFLDLTIKKIILDFDRIVRGLQSYLKEGNETSIP